MTSDATLPPLLPDLAAIPLEVMFLSEGQIEQALVWSQVASIESQQWRLYLQGLALLGFEQWLGNSTPELTLQYQTCSLLHPIYAQVLDGICQLTVGELQLCLLVTGNLMDQQVSVPRATIELPEWSPHLFVLVQVNEEQGWVTIQGGLHCDRLQRLNAVTPLAPQPDWTYAVPRNWLETSPEDLRLWLHCWQPATPPPLIALATPPLTKLSPVGLTDLAQKLRIPKQELWQVLTWEQVTALLTDPNLADMLTQLLELNQRESTPVLASSSTTPILDRAPVWTLAQTPVGQWLQTTVDDWIQDWGWVMLPPLAADWRSNGDQGRQMLQALLEQGLEIPAQIEAAYKDLTLAHIQLRLYYLQWIIPPTTSKTDLLEWTLVLVLGPQPGTALNGTVCLQLLDATNTLDQQILRPSDSQPYRYIQVMGTGDEQFWVMLTPGDGNGDESLNLRFDPPDIHA